MSGMGLDLSRSLIRGDCWILFDEGIGYGGLIGLLIGMVGGSGMQRTGLGWGNLLRIPLRFIQLRIGQYRGQLKID